VNTIQIATIILGLSAIGGLVMATIRLSGSPRPPTWIALIHGLVAVVGFGTLVSAALNRELPFLTQISIGAFGLAALGGLGLFLGFHVRKRPLPIPLVLVHGLVAVSAFVMLVMSLSEIS